MERKLLECRQPRSDMRALRHCYIMRDGGRSRVLITPRSAHAQGSFTFHTSAVVSFLVL
jgi:hypothetical protein